MKYAFHGLSGLVVGGTLAVLAQPAPAVPVFHPAIAQVSQPGESTQVDFAQHFQDLGIDGSIVIYDQNQNQTYQHNPDRNATPFPPASTFKILNSLIALETGAIASDLAILTWDGVERPIPAWNRDQNMRTAFRVSAVWFYQVIARRVGYERMQQWLVEVGYGNQMIGSAEAIDTFWLGGALQITPEEQIRFLQRLYSNDLPFSEEVMATVKDIMIVEQTPAYTIRAKTGWANDIGWYVGYVEQADNVYFFATNIDIRNDEDVAARLEVTRRCLQTLQLL